MAPTWLKGWVSRGAAPRRRVQDALIGLMGAEAEAMEVAGVAIENPHAPRLAERADRASERVLDAVRAHIEAVRNTLRR